MHNQASIINLHTPIFNKRGCFYKVISLDVIPRSQTFLLIISAFFGNQKSLFQRSSSLQMEATLRPLCITNEVKRKIFQSNLKLNVKRRSRNTWQFFRETLWMFFKLTRQTLNTNQSYVETSAHLRLYLFEVFFPQFISSLLLV